MKKQLFLLGLLSVLLFACGYKGPLYLPQKKASSQPAAASHKYPVMQNESQIESQHI